MNTWCWLTFYFTPTILDAFDTVGRFELSGHQHKFMRSIHRWASNLMCLDLVLHLSRVYLSGGFKKPRELTWVSGTLLALSALGFGVSGYSLPWDQVGFWALHIVSAVPEVSDEYSFAGVFELVGLSHLGSSIVCTIRGGFSVGQETLNRCFTAHSLTLPAVVAIISLVHFLLIRNTVVHGGQYRGNVGLFLVDFLDVETLRLLYLT
jgi:cytochrome b6